MAKRKSGSKKSSKGWSASERKGKRAAMLRRSKSKGKSLISVVGNRYKVKGHAKSFVTWHRAKKAANRIKASR